jgi:hypothetical protein
MEEIKKVALSEATLVDLLVKVAQSSHNQLRFMKSDDSYGYVELRRNDERGILCLGELYIRGIYFRGWDTWDNEYIHWDTPVFSLINKTGKFSKAVFKKMEDWWENRPYKILQFLFSNLRLAFRVREYDYIDVDRTTKFFPREYLQHYRTPEAQEKKLATVKKALAEWTAKQNEARALEGKFHRLNFDPLTGKKILPYL